MSIRPDKSLPRKRAENGAKTDGKPVSSPVRASEVDQRYQRRDRLDSDRAFRRVFGQKRRAGDARMVVYVADSDSGRSRLGFRVSTKVGSAVVRNRIRRRVREVFRRERSRFPGNLDIICVIKPGPEAGLPALGESLLALVAKAAARKRHPRSKSR